MKHNSHLILRVFKGFDVDGHGRSILKIAACDCMTGLSRSFNNKLKVTILMGIYDFIIVHIDLKCVRYRLFGNFQ